MPKSFKISSTIYLQLFLWALWSWSPIFFILENKTTDVEEYFFNIFFQKIFVLGTPEYPRVLPLGVKTPKRIIFGSNFFPNRFFELTQENWHQDCPFGQRPRRGQWPMVSYMRNFLLLFFSVPLSNPSLEAQIPVSRPKSQTWGQNLASRPRSQLWGPNLSLQARIWAWRLG